ncbi:MAG: PRC-barrel domain-containing protein [Halobacteria archaeon]
MRMEMSSFHGLDVYTTRGKYVGRVDDLVLDPADKRVLGLAVGNVNRDMFDVPGRGIVVPFRWVTAVGDVVLMRPVEARKAAAEKKKE